MSSRINRITFEVLPPKPIDHPVKPFCHIQVGTHTVGEEGEIRLSPQLMTNREIDEYIDYLIADLEHVRKAAKKRLAKANKGQLDHIK